MRRVNRFLVPPALAVASLCSGVAVGAGSTEAPAATAATHAEIVVLGARALFARNSSTLRAEGVAALRTLAADRVRRHVDRDLIVAIRVIGHSDSIGPAAYNHKLSERRARTVAERLAEIYPHLPLLVEGRGESVPVADNGTVAGRARNRRVEIHMISIDERR